MGEEELKEFFNLFNDCWKFVKKYGSMEKTPEYWDQLTSEGTQISAAHGGKFASDIVVAILCEMERKAKAC